MMDMPMDKPMDDKKDDGKEYFACPACGAQLCAEQKDDEVAEKSPMDKPAAKPDMDRADNMPMDKLKNVIMGAKSKEPMGGL